MYSVKPLLLLNQFDVSEYGSESGHGHTVIHFGFRTFNDVISIKDQLAIIFEPLMLKIVEFLYEQVMIEMLK